MCVLGMDLREGEPYHFALGLKISNPENMGTVEICPMMLTKDAGHEPRHITPKRSELLQSNVVQLHY